MIDVLEGFVEINLHEPDDFLKIKETLSRIGVASRKDKTLYQSCHILHKQKRYYIVHFKQMFLLDGLPSNFSDGDRARLNTIVGLLEQWGLLTVVNPEQIASPTAPMTEIKVISHREKQSWNLVTKYDVGGFRRKPHEPQ